METVRLEHVLDLRGGNADGTHTVHVVHHVGKELERVLDRISLALFQLTERIMPVLDDLEATTDQEIALLKTIHDELTAALAANDTTRIQAVVDKLKQAITDNPDPQAGAGVS